jgi:hypothetical protein
LIACWAEDPNGKAYKLHLGRIPDNYWVAEDGLKIQVIYMITPCLFQLLVFCGMRTNHNYHIQKHVCMLMQSHILKAFTQKSSLQNRGPFKIKYFILKCTNDAWFI